MRTTFFPSVNVIGTAIGTTSRDDPAGGWINPAVTPLTVTAIRSIAPPVTRPNTVN